MSDELLIILLWFAMLSIGIIGLIEYITRGDDQ